ncbi:MAG TPA: hypothetical protein VFZ87_04440 [Gemmatimonadales bacterium]
MDQNGSILQRARRHTPAGRAATAVITTLFAIKGQKLQIIVGAGVIDAILVFVTIWPQHRVSRALCAPWGPSLDAGRMTRRECLRDAGWFLLLSIVSLAIMLGSEWAGGVFDPPYRGTSASPPMLQFWYALWGFFYFMAFIAFLYLLLRAPFRPGRLSPPAAESP